jgi:predicted Zn-dependent protease
MLASLRHGDEYEKRWLSAIAALERIGTRGNAAARVAYASFLKRWPANVGAAVGLANTHYAHGGLLDAEAVLRAAKDRAPDSVVVLNNLAQVLSDQGRDEEALALIERAAAAGGSFDETVQETRQTILKRISARKKGTCHRCENRTTIAWSKRLRCLIYVNLALGPRFTLTNEIVRP